jgi:two-component system, cell cycle sensor histidine kinase and response regulator CckA
MKDEQPASHDIEKRLRRQEHQEAPRVTEWTHCDVFDAASEAIYVHDPATGELLDVNQTASELSGYSRDELLRLQADVLPADGPFSHQEAVRRIRHAIAQGPQVFEWKSRKKTGETIWVEVALRGATLNGQMRVLAVVRDITQRKRDEVALRNSEERWRFLFEHAPDAFFLHDLEGSFVDGNKAAEELIGYRREELIGRNFLQLNLLPKDGLPRAAERLAQNRQGVATAPEEFTLLRKDQRQIPAEIRGYPVELQGQKLVLAIARDLTQRKEAEKAQEELKLLLNATRGINRLIVQERDLEQLLTKACEILAQTRGYSLVWVGLPEPDSSRLRPAARAGRHTGYLDEVTVTWDEAQTGQGPAGWAMRTGQVCVSPDTATDPRFEPWRNHAMARGLVSVAAVPMIKEGKALGVITLYSDRKGTFHEAEVNLLKELASDLAFAWQSIEHERERRRAELRVTAFAYVAQRLSVAKTARQAAEIIVAVADQLVGLHACTLDLYSRDTDRLQYVLNQDIVDGQRVDCASVYNDHPPSPRIRQVIESGGQLILKENPLAMMADASPFGDTSRPSASILIVPVRDGPQVIGVLSIHSYKPNAYDYQSLDTLQALADYCGGALQRISTQEALSEREQQLRQAQKMEAVGQLAGGVAHDFNNLLAVIRGNADLLLMDPAQLSPDARVGLKEILAASERAANLTRQLLIFSRKQAMQSHPLVINDVIAELTRMLKRIIGEHVDLQCRYSADLPQVQADPGMIEQALVNLAINARDAMQRGGQLLITTEAVRLDVAQARKLPEGRTGDFVCLTVSDTGTGIAPEHLSRIFEPFFTTKEPGKGTGLGLATVHGIVKQHHGWVQVSSQPSHGATFKIFLPASSAPATSPEALRAEPPSPPGTETILLVEDDYAVRMITRRVLERHGYTVCEARSAPEALALWETRGEEIALLLSDIVMPESVTGHELAERLRAEKPSLKVILMSGYSAELIGKDTEVRRRATCFLKKPCPSRLLLETVRRCLDEK